jgi:hypothetical protein
LPPVALQALDEHRRFQREAKIRYRPLWHDSDLIFTTQIGTALDPNDVSRDFHAFLERNGLPLSASTTCAMQPARSCSRTRFRCTSSAASLVTRTLPRR